MTDVQQIAIEKFGKASDRYGPGWSWSVEHVGERRDRQGNVVATVYQVRGVKAPGPVRGGLYRRRVQESQRAIYGSFSVPA